jgi:hypothetical protein
VGDSVGNGSLEKLKKVNRRGRTTAPPKSRKSYREPATFGVQHRPRASGSCIDLTYLDVSGLSPWWVLRGAAVSRYVFNLPQSRDLEKFTLLKEQRLIYRLALGQPNQEDLVEFLTKGGPALTALLQPLALNLSAFARTMPPVSSSLTHSENHAISGDHEASTLSAPWP